MLRKALTCNVTEFDDEILKSIQRLGDYWFTSFSRDTSTKIMNNKFELNTEWKKKIWRKIVTTEISYQYSTMWMNKRTKNYLYVNAFAYWTACGIRTKTDVTKQIAIRQGFTFRSWNDTGLVSEGRASLTTFTCLKRLRIFTTLTHRCLTGEVTLLTDTVGARTFLPPFTCGPRNPGTVSAASLTQTFIRIEPWNTLWN